MKAHQNPWNILEKWKQRERDLRTGKRGLPSQWARTRRRTSYQAPDTNIIDMLHPVPAASAREGNHIRHSQDTGLYHKSIHKSRYRQIHSDNIEPRSKMKYSREREQSICPKIVNLLPHFQYTRSDTSLKQKHDISLARLDRETDTDSLSRLNIFVPHPSQARFHSRASFSGLQRFALRFRLRFRLPLLASFS